MNAKILFGMGWATLILVLLSSTACAVGWKITSEKWSCDGCCVEGDSFSVTITLKNIGTDTFHVRKVEIVDENDKSVASKAEFEYALASGESRTFTLFSIFPAPTSGTGSEAILTYKYRLEIKYWWYETKDTSYYTKQVVSKAKHECDTNSDCRYNEYCSLSNCVSECKPVVQGICGYISNHKWVNYDCCSDSDCSESQRCVNNKCEVGRSKRFSMSWRNCKAKSRNKPQSTNTNPSGSAMQVQIPVL